MYDGSMLSSAAWCGGPPGARTWSTQWSVGRLRRLTGLAHLLLHVSAFTLFIDLRVLRLLSFTQLADH